jgi:F-box protein 21
MRIDLQAMAIFNKLLSTQRRRYERMRQISCLGQDVKDLLIGLKDGTPSAAEDVLARRYYANAILCQIHRASALDRWVRLKQGQDIPLEEVLGAYDLFVLPGHDGGLQNIKLELDRCAQRVRESYTNFNNLSIRRKALQIVAYLASNNLAGYGNEDAPLTLQSNYISMALFNDTHTPSPLVSAVIYCAVARRLGIDSAKIFPYSHHAAVIIETSEDQNLDGESKTGTLGDGSGIMYLEPWHSTNEVSQEQFQSKVLSDLGISSHRLDCMLSANSTIQIARHAYQNIDDSFHQVLVHVGANAGHRGGQLLPLRDRWATFYSMLWSQILLSPYHYGHLNLSRTFKQVLTWYPEDIELFEMLFDWVVDEDDEANDETSRTLMECFEDVASARAADSKERLCSPRGAHTSQFLYGIGHFFQHRRHGFKGFIVGWNTHRKAESWRTLQMRVNGWSDIREQPFYHIMCAHESQCPFVVWILIVHNSDENNDSRHIAQDNIQILHEMPSEDLLQTAGQYFKRWDEESGKFISNIQDDYPDD